MSFRVLFVDDEPDVEVMVRQEYRRAIRSNELAVCFAQTGREALRMLEQRPDRFQLVVADVRMPHMNGLELLVESTARGLDVPFVIVSAHTDMGNVRRAMRCGAFDFLGKPLDFAELERIFAQLRVSRSDRRANRRARARLVDSSEPSAPSLRLAELGLLLAGVAHDLRSPLSFMVNLAELSRDLIDELVAESSDTQAETLALVRTNLRHIERHGQAAVALVTSVLETTSGRASQTTALDVNAELEAHVDLFVRSLNPRLIATEDLVRCELADDAGWIELAGSDFARIVVNLLRNAHSAVTAAAPRGEHSGQIAIRTDRIDDRVELRVRDNGVGIPTSDRDRIFGLMFSTTGGAGLGLALVRQLTEACGGTVDFDSREGEYTEFVLSFPRLDASATATSRTAT